MKDFDSNMFVDIQELGCCSAKAVVVIANRYNEDPRLVSQLFLDMYKKINEELANSDS